MLSQDTLENLIELRSRLIYCTIFFIIFFTCYFYNAHKIFSVLSTPLLKFLPENSQLIASDVTTPVIMPIKLSVSFAFFTSIPFIFYHAWRFIAPGLYPNEKKHVLPLVLISLFLFLTGLFFAYYFILPLMFNVFVQWLPPNVALMADINSYIDFVFKMLFIFGIVFQIPLIIIILIKFKFLSKDELIKKRPYFILLAFIISMFLTPPDVVSMILLALPICFLYQLGIIFAKFV